MEDHREDKLEWFRQVPWDPIVRDYTQAGMEYLALEKGVTEFCALGFCWGAWALAKASADGIPFKAVAAAHPSFQVEASAFQGDAEKLMTSIQCPALLLPASNDAAYTKPGSDAVKKLKPGSLSIEFPDMKHGWSTRSNLDDERIRRDVNLVVEKIVEFLLRFSS